MRQTRTVEDARFKKLLAELWMQAGLDVLSKGAGPVFVFRPGATPPQSGNVYTTWTSLYAAASKLGDQPIWLYVDDSIAPAHITSGTFALNEWTLIGNFASPTETLIFDDGAKVQSSSLVIANGLSLQSNSTSPVWQGSLQTSAFFVFSVLENSLGTFLFSPNAPFFELDAAVDFEMSLGAGTLGEGTHNVVSASAGRTISIADILGFITTHALGGAGTVSVGLGPSGILNLPQDVATLNVVQTGFASQMKYTAAVVANWSGTNPTSVANALDRIAAHVGPIP